MDFLSLAQQCGPEVNPVTTLAIIKAESAFDPLVIRDNTYKISYHPKSKEDAVVLVQKLHQRGHKLAVGLMQVTTPWFSKFDIAPDTLLNACTNIRYGTKILADNYRSYLSISSSPNQALQYALSAYWSGTPYSGGSYVNYVYHKAGSPIRVEETEGVTDGLLGATQVAEDDPVPVTTFHPTAMTFSHEQGSSLFLSR